jgi:hypothetical protein
VGFDPSQLEVVNRDDAEKIFDAFSLREIADAWCAYHVSEDKRYWWAVDLMWTDPFLEDRGRREKLIELLIETSPDDDVLAVAAAGPLEDAIYDADECVEWIETRAAASPRFRQALQGAYIKSALNPERFARLERTVGSALQ